MLVAQETSKETAQLGCLGVATECPAVHYLFIFFPVVEVRVMFQVHLHLYKPINVVFIC